VPLFVPLDVDYMSDPKILRLKDPLAELLYVRALCFAKRTLSDGFIDEMQVPTLCLGFGAEVTRRGRGLDALVTRLCRDLVSAGLWVRDGDGFRIAAWSKRNLSALAVKAASEKRRLAGQKANHERWHINGKMSSDCPFCVRFGSEPDVASYPIPSESDSTEPEPEPEPESSPSDRIDTSAASTGVRPAAAAEALELYADADLANRSITDVRDRRAYRRTVIENAAVSHGPAILALIDANPQVTALEIVTSILGVDEFTARSAWRKRHPEAS
jgi:hypothetical protein